MNQNYGQVPKIITGKDLDYLSDMFQWNYGALKSTNSMINEVENNEIKTLLNEGFDLFNNNLTQVLKILKEEQNG